VCFRGRWVAARYVVPVLSIMLYFYPRDAMLARFLAMALCLCLCLCLSVTSQCYIEMDGRSSWFLACRLFSTYLAHGISVVEIVL